MLYYSQPTVNFTFLLFSGVFAKEIYFSTNLQYFHLLFSFSFSLLKLVKTITNKKIFQHFQLIEEYLLHLLQ